MNVFQEKKPEVLFRIDNERVFGILKGPCDENQLGNEQERKAERLHS